jgi:hypothetical protein
MRNELRMRFEQSFQDLKVIQGKWPTAIEAAIHFMLTEDKSPKEIKELIELLKEEDERTERNN